MRPERGAFLTQETLLRDQKCRKANKMEDNERNSDMWEGWG